jgi:hypothetical protein
MDRTQQPKGNFIANPTRYGQDTRRPAYRGRISIPGTERTFDTALWSSTYTNPNTGEEQVYLNGFSHDVSASDSALEQMTAIASRANNSGKSIAEAGLDLRPGQIAIFPNGFKHEEGVDPEILAKRPDYYGKWNPGHGDKLVSVSVWARKGRDGGLFISGATQYPLPGKEEGREEATVDKLVADGRVSRGMPGEGRAA